MPAYPQGEPAFVDLLKRHTPFTPHWEDAECGENELDMRQGAILRPDFPDPGKLLETAYSDFNRFLAEAQLTGETVPVYVRESSGFGREEYRLTVEKTAVDIAYDGRWPENIGKIINKIIFLIYIINITIN